MTRPFRAAGVLLAVLTLAAAGLVAAPAVQAAPTQAAATGSCHRTLKTYPVLLPGARGKAVRTLQCVLNDVGSGPVSVDGWYGPQTRRAVSRIEAGFEGPAPHPGRVNNGFWVLLFGRQLPDRDLRLGQHGPAVRTLQRALRAAGGHLAVDGHFGTQTRQVVRRYQVRQQFEPTGVVDDNTRFILAMGGVLRRQN